MASRSEGQVADDHPVVRHGLVALIDHQSDLCVMAEAATGRAEVEQFAAQQHASWRCCSSSSPANPTQ
jgi:DNA-binding NarL/FixJ family response regulator